MRSIFILLQIPFALAMEPFSIFPMSASAISLLATLRLMQFPKDESITTFVDVVMDRDSVVFQLNAKEFQSYYLGVSSQDYKDNPNACIKIKINGKRKYKWCQVQSSCSDIVTPSLFMRTSEKNGKCLYDDSDILDENLGVWGDIIVDEFDDDTNTIEITTNLPTIRVHFGHVCDENARACEGDRDRMYERIQYNIIDAHNLLGQKFHKNSIDYLKNILRYVSDNEDAFDNCKDHIKSAPMCLFEDNCRCKRKYCDDWGDAKIDLWCKKTCNQCDSD